MRARGTWLSAVAVVGSVVVAGCATLFGPSIVTKFDNAKDLQNKGDYAAAIAKYNEYVAENKDSSLVPFALYNIARCNRAMYDQEKTVAAYQKLKDQYPAAEQAKWADTELREILAKPLVKPTSTTTTAKPTTTTVAKTTTTTKKAATTTTMKRK